MAIMKPKSIQRCPRKNLTCETSSNKLNAVVKRVLRGQDWYSPHKSLKWVLMNLCSEMTLTEHIHFIGEKAAENRKEETYKPSPFSVYKMLSFDAEKQEIKGYSSLFEVDEGEELVDAQLLPTPIASDGGRGGQQVDGFRKTRASGLSYSSNIVDLAVSGLLPTPTAMDAKGNVTRDRGYYNLTDVICRKYQLEPQEGGTNLLNPLYVEEMMGFPVGWILKPFLNDKE